MRSGKIGWQYSPLSLTLVRSMRGPKDYHFDAGRLTVTQEMLLRSDRVRGVTTEHSEDGIEVRLSLQIAMAPTMMAHFRVVIEPEAALGLVEWLEAEIMEWEERYGEIRIKESQGE